MKTTKELFGNVPKTVWKLQHKLAIMRIELAKKKLQQSHSLAFEERDLNDEASYARAIKFWETLRDEAWKEI